MAKKKVIQEGLSEKINYYKQYINQIKLTNKQKQLIDLIDKNQIIFIKGPAGTAKTFLLCYYVIKSISEDKYINYVLTKPIEESGEKLGFLPGDIESKINPYFESYRQNFSKIIGKENLKKLIDKELIDFRPLVYMRGTTWEKTCLIVDEAQNLDARQLMMFITRMGQNSKVIIAGDIHQYDINQKAVGLNYIIDLIEDIDDVSVFEFDEDDIMRNDILKEITKRYEIDRSLNKIPINKNK